MSVYHELFSSWEDVQHEFSMNEPEPDEVLYASYEYESYEGSADVFYRDKGKFYYVNGGHCSCMGLEGQWEPEEYSVEALVGQVERATYGFFEDQKELIMAAIDKYKSPVADIAAEYAQVEGELNSVETEFQALDAKRSDLIARRDDLKGKLRQLLN